MATEEITISELELADNVLADMTIPVDTANETRAITLKQLRAWIGSSLPTGFLIPAIGRMSDGRFTLLDGKTLSRKGTYEGFCNKVVSEVQEGNWFACTAEEYENDISNFGQCGKFVVESDYIRIPTITRFMGATITLSEIGKSYDESLPNITGKIEPFSSTGGSQSGVFYSSSGNNVASRGSGSGTSINFDASRSSKVYKEGGKVQPDHVKYPYYMVVATDGQAEPVGVDINKVYEDMNIRANTSLSNLTGEGKEVVAHLGMPSKRYTDLTLGVSGTVYDMPEDGFLYIEKLSNAADQYISMVVNEGAENSATYKDKYLVSSGWIPKNGESVGIYLQVQKGWKVKVNYTAGGGLVSFRFINAEGAN